MKKYILNILFRIVEPYYGISDSDFKTSIWLNKLYDRFLLLNRFFYIVPIKLYLKPIERRINLLVSQEKLNKDDLKEILIKTFINSSDDKKFFFSKLFYILRILDESICEQLLKFAYETNNKSYRYWTTMDISKMTFHFQTGFYPRYYEDRRLLMKKIALENCKQIYKPEENSSTNKVLILTYVMNKSMLNSMQRVSVMVANALSKRCLDVTVLSIDSFSLGKSDKKSITTLFSTVIASKIKKEVIPLYENNVNIHFIDGSSYYEKMQNVLNYIYDYNPGCIIDITDEFSPLSYFYYKDFFTCYIPMRNNISSSYYTYMLGYDWLHSEERKRYYLEIDFQNKDWMFPEYVPSCGNIMDKRDIGVSEKSFVIISIGNVKNGFSNSFIEKMANFLKDNSDFVWLFVGNGVPLDISNNYQSLIDSKRIIDWGFEKNLYGLCSACDMQLRPDITGGSGATAICSMHGKPLVMRNIMCDCLRWLGKDYSSLNTDEAIIDEILHLYKSEDYYDESSKKIKSLISKACDSEYWWDELYSIITQGDEK